MKNVRARGAGEAQETIRCTSRIVTAVGLVLLFAVVPAAGEDWTQFRGPNATGVSKESRYLPLKFSYSDKVLWSADIGEGIASPVITQGRVFATGMVGEQKFAVFAFDAAAGKELWREEFETGPLPDIVRPNTHASSTPATDGKSVYVYFSTIGMVALKASNGERLWKRPVREPVYLMGWGAAHSPVLYQDKVIFNQDDDLAPFLVAMDKQTGKEVWRTERPEMLAGYALPVLVRAGGRTDVVVAGTGKLKGYDPDTGKERWTCNTLLRTIMSTPAVQDDMIYISVQSFGDSDRVLKAALMQWKDTNQDGKLSRPEIGEPFWEKFDMADKDKDGFLMDGEMDHAFQSPNNMVGGGSIIQAIKGGGSGDVTKSHLVWNLNNRSPSNIVSPLVVDGRLFIVKRGGISGAFDAKTGATLWEQKRIRNLGNYYASPVAGDGKIYVAGENGFVVVLKQSPKLEILARNDMGEPCVATPAVADGRLYVRTLSKLYCLSEEAKAGSGD